MGQVLWPDCFMPSLSRIFDGLAIGGSTLCLVHCLILPAFLLLMPAMAASLAMPERFHVMALAFAVPTSAAALILAFRRHRNAMLIVMGASGLTLMTLGISMPHGWQETSLTVTGTLLLAATHLVNWRLIPRHTCRTHFSEQADG